MKTSTRKILDKSFSALALSSMAIMGAVAVAFLAPIIIKGAGALYFDATVEHFKFLREVLDRGSESELTQMVSRSDAAREKLYSLMRAYDFAELSGKIAAARNDAFAKAAAQSQSFIKILDENGGAAAAPIIKAEGEKLFAPYGRLVADSAKHPSPAMAEFLAGERETLQKAVRKFTAKLGEIRKLSVLEKGRIRRELPASALAAVADASERAAPSRRASPSFSGR